jgi:hypothetical protein
VLQETGSATIMGTVLTIMLVPLLIFLLVGDAAANHFALRLSSSAAFGHSAC